ncbi:GNAT family N-acetyltransferase [Marinovum sp. 2_MG-2023]|uniref:GNAT family N-acetyltransferase n=1 Tax=unclassified Marinovum TaxID=2647166 RepID=UPI0026E27078|nr:MULTISPECIES: GNAT family N-acetyltransferase [unclassified Marinovum]MDO6730787.1 GNAT family N-acetyltransferase [Marinovum sp. 2_MG-2023]MDO6780008.1 GNAT family N-acetyltransferase [Marinovum sp. 1_MG-2023]
MAMKNSDITIAPAPADDRQVAALLTRHHTAMRAGSPEESCHVQTVAELMRDGADVYAARRGDAVVAVGAFKSLGAGHAELKSMHTDAALRGQGVGQRMLDAILAAAQAKGHDRISLETGTADFFAAARALYLCNGFAPCPPFGTYRDDPLSVFMTRKL